MRQAVIDLESPRPAWRVPDWAVRSVEEALGDEWTVRRVRAAAPSDGDGGAGSEEAERAVRGAEIYIGWGVPARVVAAGADTLRWVHSAAAGVRASISPELRASAARFTNSRGVQAAPMADWVIASIGFCFRGFHAAVTAQHDRRWAKDAFTNGRTAVREFEGATVGLVGLGGIGTAVAVRCAALGMEVQAVRRRPERRRPRGVRWVGGPEELPDLASRADVLVITAAHTAATDRIVNGDVLERMSPQAFLINVARGSLIDERALLRLLDDDRLGGCVLDVFDREPLPADHPFWHHPRVMIFPHVSSVSSRFWQRETALLVDNIGRYRAGRRLRNLVNLEAGY